MLLQIWSGSSDGTVAVTDLDGSVKLDTTLARSLKTPSGKGTQRLNPTPLFSSSLPYLKQARNEAWRLRQTHQQDLDVSDELNFKYHDIKDFRHPDFPLKHGIDCEWYMTVYLH